MAFVPKRFLRLSSAHISPCQKGRSVGMTGFARGIRVRPAPTTPPPIPPPIQPLVSPLFSQPLPKPIYVSPSISTRNKAKSQKAFTFTCGHLHERNDGTLILNGGIMDSRMGALRLNESIMPS